MSESVILCEGYLDRAFWAGWLTHLGCTILRERGQVYDAIGRPVHRGQYMFRSKSERFVRVVPCKGRPNVRREARARLDQRGLRPRLTRLILNTDTDVDLALPSAATGSRHEDIVALVRQFDAAATIGPEGDIAADEGATIVSLVRWETADDVTLGVPTRQTLERVVCAALVAAYPVRGPLVDRWLKSRPDAPPARAKEFGWSYMAGWFADHGCEAFYELLWKDPLVVVQRESRLRAAGVWRVAEALAN